jgi:hypothetical protein
MARAPLSPILLSPKLHNIICNFVTIPLHHYCGPSYITLYTCSGITLHFSWLRFRVVGCGTLNNTHELVYLRNLIVVLVFMHAASSEARLELIFPPFNLDVN